jgi:hypothetical protein
METATQFVKTAKLLGFTGQSVDANAGRTHHYLKLMVMQAIEKGSNFRSAWQGDFTHRWHTIGLATMAADEVGQFPVHSPFQQGNTPTV